MAMIDPWLMGSPTIAGPARHTTMADRGRMRKLITLVEAFALAAVMVTAVTINPHTAQMMVVAVSSCERAARKRH
jgi:hypothetical protein